MSIKEQLAEKKAALVDIDAGKDTWSKDASWFGNTIVRELQKCACRKVWLM